MRVSGALWARAPGAMVLIRCATWLVLASAAECPAFCEEEYREKEAKCADEACQACECPAAGAREEELEAEVERLEAKE